jgi:hypothetical protein
MDIPDGWAVQPEGPHPGGLISMSDESIILRLKPGVGKRWLFLTAGLTWCGVGVLLNSYAAEWFSLAGKAALPYLLAAGVLVAAVFYTLIFGRFSSVNIRRIDAYSNARICIFAFQRWSSYPLVVFMIGLGIFLREFSPIPKPCLAPLYFGIGVALIIGGLKYFMFLLRDRRPAN